MRDRQDSTHDTAGATSRRPCRRREAGFTLIELLVVIIILGILSAVVVFAVRGVGDKGQAAAKAIDARTIRTAEEAFFAKEGRYATEGELVSARFLSEESSTHRVFLNNGPGSCPFGSKCDYSIGAQAEGETPTLTLYNGRTASLVDPIISQFTADTGINVAKGLNVAEGKSTLVANQILAEGADTPADVFFSQDAGNLGAVSRAGLFKPAPSGATGKVIDPTFQAADGTWVAVSGRVRVIAYNPNHPDTPTSAIPDNVDTLLGPAWSGKVAYDPLNGSFQNFVAAMILTRGENGTRAWLDGFKANAPVRISGNRNIVATIANNATNGSPVRLGLTNHYYRFQGSSGTPAYSADNVFNSYPVATSANKDPGSLINSAGIGILKNTDNPGAAELFVKYLLTTSAQTALNGANKEYPMASAVAPDPSLKPLKEIESPNRVLGLNLNSIDNSAAVSELTSAGLLP